MSQYKGIKLVALTLLMVFVLVFSVQAAEKKKTVIFGIDADFPPWTWFEKGKFHGFDYEVLKAIAEHSNLNVEWKALPWETAVPALGAGKIDLLSGGMGITCKREAIVSYSEPYYAEPLNVLVKKDSELNVATALCCGAKIGALAGSVQYRWLTGVAANKKTDIKVVPYETSLLAVKDLAVGRIDTIVMTEISAIKFSQKHPLKKIGQNTGKPFPLEKGYGMTRGDPKKLLPIINDGLKWLWETGQFQRLWDKNMPEGTSPKGPVPLVRKLVCK